jgi:hypothetical protein
MSIVCLVMASPNIRRDSSGSVFEPIQTPRQQQTRKQIANTFLTSLGEPEILRTLDTRTDWSHTSKAAKSEGLTSLARIVKAGCSTIAPGKEAEVLYNLLPHKNKNSVNSALCQPKWRFSRCSCIVILYLILGHLGNSHRFNF